MPERAASLPRSPRKFATPGGHAPAPTGASPLAARAAALDILGQVLQRGRPLDDALADSWGAGSRAAGSRAAGSREGAALAPRDRAFARLLTATTLRRLGQIDALVAACLAKPLAPKAAVIVDILRLGAAQLLFLGTPGHAAVDTAVALTRARRLGNFAGLVNAVLRRLARDGAAMLAGQDAARLNTPDWLWASWCAAYGEAAARAIATAHLAEPPLDLTLARPAETARWADALQAEPLPNGTLRRTGGGRIEDLPGFAEGAWWVQDAAAALPVQLLLQGLIPAGTGAAGPAPMDGRQIIDLCAAPGGKTAQLAAAGARVTAVDHSATRLQRLSANLDRLGLSARTVAADAGSWRPEAPADAVLLDAPCTATGTIRRHPDIPWNKRPEDLVALAAAQDRLLAAAVEMLRPGGILVYCTCSLQPEEGAARVATLVASGAPVRPLPVRAGEMAGIAGLLDGDGWLRSRPDHWPEHGGLDGFFAARLVRAGT